MATKQQTAVDSKAFKTPEPSGVAPETPKASPLEIIPHQQEMPFEPAQLTGYRQLSDDEIRRVNNVKRVFDETIKYIHILRDSYHDAEVQRMFSIAITNAETASMWAVKAITARA
jgi:hypothetical protein